MSGSGDEDAATGVRVVRPRWGDALLVCGKCLKRHPDGKAMRRAVKAEVKLKSGMMAKRRRVRIIRTACVGLCPRRAIVVASAATLSAGEVMLIRDANDVPDALTRLLPKRIGS